MPDYSYITRALLGLGPSDNMRYRNGFAVGARFETAAPVNIDYNVTDPSHVFLNGATTGSTTDFNLPGKFPSQGDLVNGLYYSVKNIGAKGSSKGSNYTIKINGKIDNNMSTIITLHEQDSVQLVYSDEMYTWFIISKYTEW